jgi:hypothetical protein
MFRLGLVLRKVSHLMHSRRIRQPILAKRSENKISLQHEFMRDRQPLVIKSQIPVEQDV